MTRKNTKDNPTRPTGKKAPFWLDPQAQPALDCELVDAVNKIVWKNMHRGVFGISERLEKAGIFTRSSLSPDPARVGGLLELINHDIDAAKEFFFKPPKTTHDPKNRDAVRECRAALKSQLIFAGVLSEEGVSTMAGARKNSLYLTLYAIFRKPKTNACFVGILGIKRRRAKNLADGRGKCSCEND